jgi:hypothetical protein
MTQQKESLWQTMHRDIAKTFPADPRNTPREPLTSHSYEYQEVGV